MNKSDRSYRQWCPIAAGLDVLGDRWVLLICRELSMGDRRFTDLRAALPGIAPNLLTDRLRSLADEGLVTTAELPPPAARTVYRLTEDGRRVVPVLRALARFGARHLGGEAPEEIGARRVASALLLPWWRSGSADLRVRLDIGGGKAVDLVTHDGRVQIEDPIDGDGQRPAVPEPDVIIEVDPDALARARRDGTPLEAVVRGPGAKRRLFAEAYELTLAR